jgi:hypothetical protein
MSNNLYAKIISLFGPYDREAVIRVSASDIEWSFDSMRKFLDENGVAKSWDSSGIKSSDKYVNNFLAGTVYLWNDCIISQRVTDQMFFGRTHHVCILGNDEKNIDRTIEKITANKHHVFISRWERSDIITLDDKFSSYANAVKQ